MPGAAPAPAPVPSEFADLDKLQIDQAKDYDADTARQTPRIRESYAALGTALNQNADATKDRLASLGSLIQASPTVGGAPSPVAGGPGALADAARQGFGASAAVTVGQQSALPAIAATTGQQYLDQFLAARSGGRDTMLNNFRTTNSEAAQASADRAAQIRGQNLQLLGTQLSQAGQNTRAELASDTTLQTNADDNATDIAQTNATNATRMTIAEIQAAARATTTGKNAKPAAGRPGSPQYSSARQKYVTNLSKDFFREIRDPKTGIVTEELLTEDATASILRGMALGLRPAHVFQALRGVNPGYGTDRDDAREFQAALESGGVTRKRANAITKALTGFDIYPRAGYTGV